MFPQYPFRIFSLSLLVVFSLLVMSPSRARADLMINYDHVAGDSWAINPNNVLGVRFYYDDTSFALNSARLFVGISGLSPITADVSVVQFDSAADNSATILGTVSGVSFSHAFPTDFDTQSTAVDFQSLGINIERDNFYGFVVHNPSAGFLIGAVDNSNPEADIQAITSGTFPGVLPGSAGQDMAFRVQGTAIPEPHEVMLLAIWAGVFGYAGRWWYRKKRMNAAAATKK